MQRQRPTPVTRRLLEQQRLDEAAEFNKRTVHNQ